MPKIDAPGTLHRLRQCHVVDEGVLDRANTADALQCLAADQHRAARGAATRDSGSFTLARDTAFGRNRRRRAPTRVRKARNSAAAPSRSPVHAGCSRRATNADRCRGSCTISASRHEQNRRAARRDALANAHNLPDHSAGFRLTAGPPEDSGGPGQGCVPSAELSSMRMTRYFPA